MTSPAAHRLDPDSRFGVLQPGPQRGVTRGVGDRGAVGRRRRGHRGHGQTAHFVVGIAGGDDGQIAVHRPGIAQRQESQPPGAHQPSRLGPLRRVDHGDEPRLRLGRQRPELAVDAHQRLEPAGGALDAHRIGRLGHRGRGSYRRRPRFRGRQSHGDGLFGGGEVGRARQGDAAERRGEHRPVGRRRRAHRLGQRLDRLRRKHPGGVGGGDRRGVAHVGIRIRQQRDDLPDQGRRFEASHRSHRLGANLRAGRLEALGERRHRLGGQVARVLHLEDAGRQRRLGSLIRTLSGGGGSGRRGEHRHEQANSDGHRLQVSLN